MGYEKSVSTGAHAKILISLFLPFSTASATSDLLHCGKQPPKFIRALDRIGTGQI
jgi:hypothetical protein